MIPLHYDPWFTFRFADDRIVPRFHLEGIEAGRRVSVLKINPTTGERLGSLGAARRIAGGHGGAVHNRQIEVGGDRSCRIEDFAAPGSDDHLSLVLPGGFLDSFDFSERALAAEGMNRMGHPCFAEGA